MRITALCLFFGFLIVLLTGCGGRETTNDSTPSWVNDTYPVVGTGTGPEQYLGKPNYRLMARRGAMLDATRRFLEYARGLQIDSHTYVKDFVTVSDEMIGRAQGWAKGGTVTSEKMNQDGSYEVTMEFPMVELWKYIKSVRRESY